LPNGQNGGVNGNSEQPSGGKQANGNGSQPNEKKKPRSKGGGKGGGRAGTKPGAITRFQRFKPIVIHRRKIKNAPYNPRTMDKYAKKKLREEIKANGLVEPLVWNKRTGNLVGGHQRLEQLDALEGKQDYQLTVAAIDVPTEKEIAINVALNNPNLQGAWDYDLLEQALGEAAELGGDVTATGFDRADLAMMFDDGIVGELFGEQAEAEADVVAELDQMREIGNEAAKDEKSQQEAIDAAVEERLAEVQKKEEEKAHFNEIRDGYKEQCKDANAVEFMLVVVFDNEYEMNHFLVAADLPTDERYVSGRKLADRVGIELPDFTEEVQKGPKATKNA